MVAINPHQISGSIRIRVHTKYQVDDIYKHMIAIAMGIRRKTYPRDQPRERARQDPRKIERGVMRVKKILLVVIMAPLLTMPPIFGAFVFILVPTRFMEHMLAFHDNLVAFLERSLAEITRLLNQNTIISHIFPRITGDILPLE